MRRDRLKSARFTAGRARWRRPSGVRKLTGIPMRFTVGPRPDVGSQPSHTENTKMSISPTQKVGRENPRIEPAMMALPAADRGFRPAQSPRGIPSSTAISIAALASSSVAGMRSRIRPIAGTLKAKDLPRSPAVACPMKTKYCSRSGRSRPSVGPVEQARAAGRDPLRHRLPILRVAAEPQRDFHVLVGRTGDAAVEIDLLVQAQREPARELRTGQGDHGNAEG